MWPIINGAKSIQVTSADAAATAFADHTAKLVMIQADPTNTGTVQILGTDGSTIDTAGPVLAAGDWLPTLTIQNLNRLAYKASGAGVKVNVLIGR